MSWALTPPTPEINCCRTYINNGSLKKGCEKIVTDLSKCKDAVASWDKAARKWNKAILKKNTKKTGNSKKILTSEDCANQGGRVVNILSENCSSQENKLGEVKGLRCPCVCCK